MHRRRLPSLSAPSHAAGSAPLRRQRQPVPPLPPAERSAEHTSPCNVAEQPLPSYARPLLFEPLPTLEQRLVSLFAD